MDIRFDRHTLLLCAGIAGLFCLSFVAFLYSPLNTVAFWAIAAVTLLLTLRRLEYGVLIVFTELFLGSKGYLFSATIGGAAISLRMALFIVVIGIWVARRLTVPHALSPAPFRSYIPLFAMILWGIVVGLVRGNTLDTLLFDVNGYFFFAYLGPVFEVFAKKEARERLLRLLAASVAVQALFTVVLAIVFARGFFDLASPLYRWVRVTGLGEITLLDNGIARVFFQSHLFALAALFIFGFQRLRKSAVSMAGAVSVWLSLSRSFWVGALAGLAMGWGAFLRTRALSASRRIADFLSPILVFGAAFLFIVLIIPNFGDAIFGRVGDSDGPATSSRMKLLPVLIEEIKKHPIAGSGFGKTVTYVTDDPRARARESSGRITTYSFEWGYLDFWIKMGIGGLLAYLYLLVAIFSRGWRTLRSSSNAAPLLAALAALAVTHTFSPYLNHPLGIGFVLFADVLLVNSAHPAS